MRAKYAFAISASHKFLPAEQHFIFRLEVDHLKHHIFELGLELLLFLAELVFAQTLDKGGAARGLAPILFGVASGQVQLNGVRSLVEHAWLFLLETVFDGLALAQQEHIGAATLHLSHVLHIFLHLLYSRLPPRGSHKVQLWLFRVPQGRQLRGGGGLHPLRRDAGEPLSHAPRLAHFVEPTVQLSAEISGPLDYSISLSTHLKLLFLNTLFLNLPIYYSDHPLPPTTNLKFLSHLSSTHHSLSVHPLSRPIIQPLSNAYLLCAVAIKDSVNLPHSTFLR